MLKEINSKELMQERSINEEDWSKFFLNLEFPCNLKELKRL